MTVLDTVYIGVYGLQNNEEQEYTLQELAEKTNTPPRTIRYYISKQLLPPPIRAGRDAAYSSTHVERLETIQVYKKQGYTLNEIKRIVIANGNEVKLPEPIMWQRYRISDYLEVNVRSDTPPWLYRGILNQIQRIKEFLNRGINIE